MKWITIGKGEEQKHIPVEEEPTPVVSPELYDLPENSPDAYQDLVASIAKMYNNTDDLISEQLSVQQIILGMQDKFLHDEEAYKELQATVTHLYQRLVALQAHLKNLNKTSLKKGLNLKYLAAFVSPLVKQSQFLLNVLQRIQNQTPEDELAVQREQNITVSLTQMEAEIQRLRTLEYDDSKKGKISTDWNHIRKSALKRFVEQTGPAPSSEPINSEPVPSGNSKSSGN